MATKTQLCGGREEKDVSSVVSNYLNFHDDSSKGSNEAKRKVDYATMINHYYDLATDFYEKGWGCSFHFGGRYRGEAFDASLSRAEHWLAHRLRLEKGQRVLDVGCGVGGPARSIARFAEVRVTGLNNNAYQLERAKAHTAKAGIEHLMSWVKADFMHMPFEDNTFDAIYQIEATAHAPDKAACYKEIKRVLKPGGLFASYEWCLTDKYDPENPEHRAIKKGIEEGDGLPDIATTAEVVEAMREAGFEVLDEEDRVLNSVYSDLTWYHALEPKYWPLQNIIHTSVGRGLIHFMVKVLETVGLAPSGSLGVQKFLETAGESLVRGGQLGIFTPTFFTLVRKPEVTEDDE